jgi:magnesium transporter
MTSSSSSPEPQAPHPVSPEGPESREGSASEDRVDFAEQLREHLLNDDGETLAAWIESLAPGEIVRSVSQLSSEEQGLLLQILDPEDAADLIDDLPDEQSADLLEDIPPEQAAAIIGELDSDDRADVLHEMEAEEAEAILQALPPEEAREARQLLAFPPDTAGGVMVKELVAYPYDTTVEDVLEDLLEHREEYAHYNVQYFYVVDRGGALQGVLRLRDLVLSPPGRPVHEVMIRNPQVAPVDLDVATLQQIFETHSYSALPVVDGGGRLLGAVLEKEVAEAARKSASRTLLKLAGIFGGEELRSMPLRTRARRRLVWLIVMLVLNLCAASVVALYTETLKETIALAVFLPVVAGMSGSCGNQAVGLSLRELALGMVKPWDLLYVLMKEMKVGIVNGIALGMLLGITAGLWQGYGFGLVVGGALACNTLIAVCIGGMLPLMLKRLKLDPAMASSPILTMLSDVAGFFLLLGMAAPLLSRFS